MIGVGLFLGVAGLFYSLLLGYGAFAVAIMAVALALDRRSAEPLLRLAAAGVIAGAIMLIGWLPFLLAAIGGSATWLGHRAALPAARRCAAVLPHAGVHPARCAVHGRHAVARHPRSQFDARRRAGVRRRRGLCLVAGLDADHAGGHHSAVLPTPADADGSAHRRRGVRLHRRHARRGPPVQRRHRRDASSWPPVRWARSAP